MKFYLAHGLNVPHLSSSSATATDKFCSSLMGLDLQGYRYGLTFCNLWLKLYALASLAKKFQIDRKFLLDLIKCRLQTLYWRLFVVHLIADRVVRSE